MWGEVVKINGPWVRVSKGKYNLLALLVRKFNEAVEEVNAVNGGVPAGHDSWEEADELSKPSVESMNARAKVEQRERSAAEAKGQ